MSERAVEAESQVQDDDERDRVTRAMELTDRFDELREQKRKQVTAERRRGADREDGDVFTGWITSFEEKHNVPENIFVTVEYVDEGEEKKRTFALPEPKTPGEYAVDNDLVRLLEYVTDGTGRFEDALDREVPLKKVDGDVKPDLPGNGIMAEQRHATRRKIDMWGDSTRLRRAIGNTGRLGLAGGIVGLSAQTIGMFAAADVSLGVVGVFSALCGIIAVLISVLAALVADGVSGDDSRVPDAVFLTTFALFAAVPPLLTSSGVVDIATVIDGGQKLTGVGLFAAGSLACHAAMVAALAWRPGKDIRGWASRQFGRARRWLQHQRGIEYVRD